MKLKELLSIVLAGLLLLGLLYVLVVATKAFFGFIVDYWWLITLVLVGILAFGFYFSGRDGGR
jgi:hypothetical protein